MGIARSVSGVRAREDIKAVIERDELAPLFQPIMDLRTGLAAGYEALSRFLRGRLDVPAWFEEAHRYGMGARLEAHAVACALAVPRRPFGAFLSLNLSPMALISTEVQRVLPERLDGLVVELTGQGTTPTDDALRAACQDVRARGGRLAVDLAGSDHGGVRELLRAAPDVLKLDRVLVHRVHVDPVKAALVGSVVVYARELGITVCGEGVEALDDLERLAELDVDLAQGYVTGRPAGPWMGVDPSAARICTTSAAASIMGATRRDDRVGDRRLQWLAWRLSEAMSWAGLDEAVRAVAAELGADDVIVSLVEGAELVVVNGTGPDRRGDRLRIADYPEARRALRHQSAAQIHVTDPEADPAQVDLLRRRGYRSLLILPASCAGRTIGLLEAYSVTGRPFSRFEIGRARIIALQLGATLERITRV